MLQRTLPAGFIAPCLPSKTDKLPCGSQWLHEIKHDGFRVIARKTGAQVRLSRSTDQAMTMSNSRRAASRHSLSNAGRLSRPLVPLMP
jgi:hypothetical protein